MEFFIYLLGYNYIQTFCNLTKNTSAWLHEKPPLLNIVELNYFCTYFMLVLIKGQRRQQPSGGPHQHPHNSRKHNGVDDFGGRSSGGPHQHPHGGFSGRPSGGHQRTTGEASGKFGKYGGK